MFLHGSGGCRNAQQRYRDSVLHAISGTINEYKRKKHSEVDRRAPLGRGKPGFKRSRFNQEPEQKSQGMLTRFAHLATLLCEVDASCGLPEHNPRVQGGQGNVI